MQARISPESVPRGMPRNTTEYLQMAFNVIYGQRIYCQATSLNMIFEALSSPARRRGW